MAALILADNAVRVEGGFIILRATGGRLAAIGTEVQAAITRGTKDTRREVRPLDEPSVWALSLRPLVSL